MENRHLTEFLEFLSFSSISSLPQHSEDMRNAAKWLCERMQLAGFTACTIINTRLHPVVTGEVKATATGNVPTVLVYAHYDTQPPGPLDLWKSPPFEPEVRDGNIYARGATDNKGGVFGAIVAAEQLIKKNDIPVNLKFVFEGEEEIGSSSLCQLLISEPHRFACDVAMSLDGGMYSREQPSICTGCRGIASIRIKVIGPSHDVHSGGYGGVINNPLQALAEIIASFKDRNGKVKVQGFYDDVVLPTEEERAEYKRFPFNEQVVAEKLGVPQLFGEKDFTPVERMWIRPTLDANGMWGGFQGEGSSTIIPADAQCSITCRLVPNQDPETICKLLDSHIHKHVPPGVRVETRYHAGYARPYMVDKNHPAVTALAQALHELYGVEPIYTRAGGSLPFVATMSEALSAPVLLTGMGSPGSNVHGPNEFFAIQDFDRLVKMLPMVWSKLAVMLRK